MTDSFVDKPEGIEIGVLEFLGLERLRLFCRRSTYNGS